MPLQKTEAIILKSFKQGETSKILTLYTRAFGKIKVIAKGARSSKSRFGGSLEPLNYVSIVFYEKENRDLQTLSQADIIESFQQIRKDLEKTVLAMACCEMLDRIEFGVTPNPRLFRLLALTLRSMNQANQSPISFYRAYQVHLFDLLGIQPNFAHCLSCHLTKEESVSFDLGHGGYYCDACSHMATPSMILAPATLRALQILQSSPIDQLNGALSLAANTIDDFLDAYLKYHVEGMRDLKTMKVLRSIESRLGARMRQDLGEPQ